MSFKGGNTGSDTEVGQKGVILPWFLLKDIRLTSTMVVPPEITLTWSNISSVSGPGFILDLISVSYTHLTLPTKA